MELKERQPIQRPRKEKSYLISNQVLYTVARSQAKLMLTNIQFVLIKNYIHGIYHSCAGGDNDNN